MKDNLSRTTTSIPTLELGSSKIDESLVLHLPFFRHRGHTKVLRVTWYSSKPWAFGASELVEPKAVPVRLNWHLEADALYIIRDLAKSVGNICTVYISTVGGQPRELSHEEYKAECQRRWPEEFQREAASIKSSH